MPQLRTQQIAVVVRAIDQTTAYSHLFHHVRNHRGNAKEDPSARHTFERDAVKQGKEDEHQGESDVA